MNPQFAPAYAAISSIYSLHPETREKAFATGRKAIELEPGNLAYAASYCFVLLNAGKTANAKAFAARIQAAARTPAELENAQQLSRAVASREDYDRQVATFTQRPSEDGAPTGPPTQERSLTVNIPDQPTDTSTNTNPSASSKAPNPGVPPPTPSAKHTTGTEFAFEGKIASVDCGKAPGKITLSANNALLKFHFADFAAVDVVTSVAQDSGEPPACANWKGRRVRLYLYNSTEKDYLGEVNTIQFF